MPRNVGRLGFTHKDTCRICAGTDLIEVLDLGSAPPANAYLRQEDVGKPELTFPLVLSFCRTCSLAQLLDVVDPEILFKDYRFITGTSAPSVDHFRRYAQAVIKPLVASKEDLIVDIGGNDGVLLGFVKDFARVLNVDPADNLATLSEQKGVPFYSAFFSSQVADDLIARYGPARVATANNVFAHTDPLRDAFAGVAKLIGEDGVFIFEVHWAKHLLDAGCFDQIYHEHLCYYSLHALTHLVESAGMRIFDVEIVPVQGQSLRVYAAKSRAPSERVAQVLRAERERGVTTEAAWHGFAEVVRGNKVKVLALLRELKAQGKKIVGYGAPAKASSLLNYYRLGPETLNYLTDTTPLKQGLFSPGMHIPIVAPERLRSDTPDYIFLMAWNFKDVILEKERALRERGVKFIITVPAVEIL